jgi:hypothetical protein
VRQGRGLVEAMMTVVTTLKQQHQRVPAYMPDGGQAAYTGEAAPALLPPCPDLQPQLSAVA